MGKPKAPKAPDYAAAATAQGDANVQSSMASNWLNQANQVTPYGTLSYSYSKPVAATAAEPYQYNPNLSAKQNAAAQTAWNAAHPASTDYKNPAMAGQTDANGGHYLSDGTYIPQATVTTTLSPDQQKLLDQESAISIGLGDLAQQGLGYVGTALDKPLTADQFRAQVQSVPGQTFQTGLAAPTQGMTGSVDPSKLRNYATNPTIALQSGVKTSPYQSGLDFSKVSAAPTLDSFSKQRDQITNAMMARLQPYIDREKASMETSLANQGINRGSEAYGWDQTQFAKNVNDQRIAALLAGDQEQQNLFNNAMGLRQQGVNEVLAGANQANTAAAGNFSQGLANANLANAAQAQQFGQNQQQFLNYNQTQKDLYDQRMQNAILGNSVNNTQFQQNLSAGQFANQAKEAQFNQGLAGAQFENQARSQAIQEADYFRNQPLNMLNALRSGAQVTSPQFGNYMNGAQVAAAPVYQATSDQYAAALNRYNTQMQGYSGLMQGLGSLGGSAITAGFGGGA